MRYEVDFHLATSRQLEEALGKRIEDIRLSRNITQKMLANEAGISERTLWRLETGHGVSLDTFIRVLIALKLQDRLVELLPDQEIRPMERIMKNKTERKRARPIKNKEVDDSWSWSEDNNAGN